MSHVYNYPTKKNDVAKLDSAGQILHSNQWKQYRQLL